MQQLQHRRHVQLHQRLIVEALVAEIDDEGRTLVTQIGEQRGVVVEIADLETRDLGKRRLQTIDGGEVIGVEGAFELHAVRQPRIAQDHGDLG